MKILVLGSTGMLGHQLVKSLSVNHEVITTNEDFNVLDGGVGFYVRWYEPQVVINCIGIVKQRQVETEEMIEVNALFPHRLAKFTREHGARLIHFSTDCVFSGREGHYTENDEPDPQDLYGRSKLLGEVYDQGCITLRTSIIGRELNGRKQGLVEWLLNYDGVVPGYTFQTFTGLTTIEMARVVERVLRSPDAHGVWHVGGYPVSKCWLLEALIETYRRPNRVQPMVSDHTINRCLDSTRFCKYFGYEPPTWRTMIEEMANAER